MSPLEVSNGFSIMLNDIDRGFSRFS